MYFYYYCYNIIIIIVVLAVGAPAYSPDTLIAKAFSLSQ